MLHVNIALSKVAPVFDQPLLGRMLFLVHVLCLDGVHYWLLVRQRRSGAFYYLRTIMEGKGKEREGEEGGSCLTR